jgi:hypothetical protein
MVYDLKPSRDKIVVGVLNSRINLSAAGLTCFLFEEQMGDIICIKLLYATFLSCYFNSFDPSMCFPQQPFQPIYTMSDCGACEPETNTDWDKLIIHENKCEP